MRVRVCLWPARREWTYAGNLDARGKVRLALDLGAVQAAQDLAVVGRERHQHLGALAAHRHEADRRLGVCLRLGRVEQRHGIGLGLEAGRPVLALERGWEGCGWTIVRVVTVPTALAVVDTACWKSAAISLAAMGRGPANTIIVASNTMAAAEVCVCVCVWRGGDRRAGGRVKTGWMGDRRARGWMEWMMAWMEMGGLDGWAKQLCGIRGELAAANDKSFSRGRDTARTYPACCNLMRNPAAARSDCACAWPPKNCNIDCGGIGNACSLLPPRYRT